MASQRLVLHAQSEFLINKHTWDLKMFLVKTDVGDWEHVVVFTHKKCPATGGGVKQWCITMYCTVLFPEQG